MDPDKIKAALEAIETGDSDAALVILKEMIAAAAGAGDDSADDNGDDALADDPPDDEEKLESHPDDEDKEEKLADHDKDDDKDDDKEMSALARATGHKSDAALAKSYKKLQARVSTLDAESAEIELSARRELVADLVKLGVETPATAWRGDAEKRIPVKRLMSEPITGLRDRVDAMRAVRPMPLEAPTPGTRNHKALTKVEQAGCKRLGITADEFNERKAAAAVRSN